VNLIPKTTKVMQLKVDNTKRITKTLETSKRSKESWPKGPGFGYPQRGFALLAIH
jgi:hypothetical protein